MSIKEQSLTGVKWNALGHFFTHGVNFVLGLLIARMLMPEDYGVIGMLAIFTAIANAFVDSGFSNALVRKPDRTEVDCSTAFYFNIVVGALAYGLLFLGAPLIAAFYDMPILTDVIRVLSLTIFINSLGIVPNALRTVAIDFKSQAYASVFSAIISGLIGLYMAYHGYGVWALVWQTILGAALGVVIIWLLARWTPSWTYSWQSFRTMFSYGSKLLLSSLIHRTYTYVSNLLIGKFYTPTYLGYYDRGLQMAAWPSLKMFRVLHGVTFPILAKVQDDNQRLMHVYREYQSMISMTVFFIMTLLAAVAEPLITLLLTAKWLGAVPYLRVFCLAFMFDTICQLNNNLLYVKGRSDMFLKLEIIKKLIVTPFLLMAIPLGVMAICFVAVVHTAVDIACTTYYIKRLLGIKGQLFPGIGKFFLLSLLACSPAYLICSIGLSPWMSLPVGSMLAAGLYYAFLHRHPHMKELLQMLKSIL